MHDGVRTGLAQCSAERVRVANVELGRDRVVQGREQVRADEPLPAGHEHGCHAATRVLSGRR